MPKSINKGVVVAIPIVAVSALMLMTPMLAAAQNPHFVNPRASESGNNLVCSFKEAGLGSGQEVTITCSADATAEYQCINRGGNNPQAENKRTVNSEVSESGDFTASKSGQVTGSLTINPPSAGDFTCPSGQRLTLVSVTYENVVLTDETTGASATL
jgi:hypothetical protein